MRSDIHEGAESPNEGACLRYGTNPEKPEAYSLNPKVESGGHVTPKFGC